MPLRVRRLIFHALVLLALCSFALPFFEWFLGFGEEIRDRYLTQRWGVVTWFVGFGLASILGAACYLATFAGLFLFYGWSRYALVGFGMLWLCLWVWLWRQPALGYAFYRVSVHLVLALLLLVAVWSPFVGSQFRRLARHL